MKTVSVVIPCRNEENYIEDCIYSILEQDYPIEEVLVVDGMSTDRTRSIVLMCGATLLDNIQKTTQHAINMGFKWAKGDYILEVDAHSTASSNYVSECVKVMNRYTYAAVGGETISTPGSNSLLARCIATIWRVPFGRGGISQYRERTTELREVSSMHCVMRRREIFEKIGGYNEKLTHSHDLEYDTRMKQIGIKLLQIPNIYTYYRARATFKAFIKKAWTDGEWVIYPRKLSNVKFLTFRHYVPLFFVLTLPISIWPYIPLSIYNAIKIAREEGLASLFLIPFIFFSFHMAYGLGSLWALLNLWRIK